MITIIHGDDNVASRNHLVLLREKAANPLDLRGDKLTLTDLVQAIEGNSLFFEEKDIFIENFLAQKKTNKQFKEIVEFIEKNHKIANIIFWENQEISKSAAATFKESIVKGYKLPQSLFLFLDNLRSNNKNNVKLFREVISQTSEELVFYMIVRQFRIMLALLLPQDDPVDELKRLAPWQRGKVERQAASFGLEKLKNIYSKLYEMDYKQKYGLTTAPLARNIDFFLMEI
jgi:hypothetical protein